MENLLTVSDKGISDVIVCTKHGFESVCDSDIDRNVILNLSPEEPVEIPHSFDGALIVSGNSYARVDTYECEVIAEKECTVEVYGDSYIGARDNATVILHDFATVYVEENSNVVIKSEDIVIEVTHGFGYNIFHNFKGGKVFLPGKCEN